MQIQISKIKDNQITNVINCSQKNSFFVKGTLSNMTNKNNRIAKIIS